MTSRRTERATKVAKTRRAKVAASILTSTVMLAFSPAFADVADVTITEAGARQFSHGDEYGKLKNEASGEVTLTSSGGVVEEDAISFTNFDAVANAKTTFSGGRWNFGDVAIRLMLQRLSYGPKHPPAEVYLDLPKPNLNKKETN